MKEWAGDAKANPWKGSSPHRFVETGEGGRAETDEAASIPIFAANFGLFSAV